MARADGQLRERAHAILTAILLNSENRVSFAVKKSVQIHRKLAAILVCASMLWVSPFAQAQDTVDNSDFEHATGAILPTDEEIAQIPPVPLTRAFLPELVDFSKRMPPVGSQGRLGSCVSWAVGYAARSYYAGLKGDGALRKSSIPSPAFLHGLIRNPDGRSQCSGGASIPSAFLILERTGSASLAQMPYSDRRCDRPSEELIDEVAENGTFRIERRVLSPGGLIGIREPSDLDKFKAELARGHPVVIGIKVDKAFHRLRGRTVWSGMGDPNSGHAITLVGYNEKGQYFKFINSWGTDWGDRGYGRISYQSLVDQSVVGATMRVAGVEPPQPSPGPGPDPAPPKPPLPGEIDLPEVSCGLLEQELVDGNHTITGFVREAADLKKIEAAIGERDIEMDVDLRPWPQCETLMTLRDPLADRGKPMVELPKATYSEGETLSFSVGMAPFEGYLHVAYVQADGNVVNLVQQSPNRIQTLDRGKKLVFGDGKDGRAKFTVSGPYGEEMVIAVSSASPLFPEPRPTVEVERTFLTALRRAILARPDPNLPERRISAAYAILETKGDKP